MPLTLEDFLAVEPTLARLRHDIETLAQSGRRQERHLVELLVGRWDAGLAGWLTEAEAEQLAAEFQADARARGVNAAAAVETRYAGGTGEAPFLVFSGGPNGHHVLSLASTSPVRARACWADYTADRPAPPIARSVARRMGLQPLTVGGER